MVTATVAADVLLSGALCAAEGSEDEPPPPQPANPKAASTSAVRRPDMRIEMRFSDVWCCGWLEKIARNAAQRTVPNVSVTPASTSDVRPAESRTVIVALPALVPAVRMNDDPDTAATPTTAALLDVAVNAPL